MNDKAAHWEGDTGSMLTAENYGLLVCMQDDENAVLLEKRLIKIKGNTERIPVTE